MVFCVADNWACVCHCILLCRHCKVRGGDAAGKQGLPMLIHNSTAGSSTIPSADLKGITTNKKVPTFSGLSKHVIPSAWALGLEITRLQNVQLAGLCWQSMLAMVGDVFEHDEECLTPVCVTCVVQWYLSVSCCLAVASVVTVILVCVVCGLVVRAYLF